jgi:hypothetical protein
MNEDGGEEDKIEELIGKGPEIIKIGFQKKNCCMCVGRYIRQDKKIFKIKRQEKVSENKKLAYFDMN